VVLLYRWVRDGTGGYVPADQGVALLAALLFVSALPFTGGIRINARSPMLVGVLLAVRSSRPLVRGAGIAAGSLFSQYAIFGVPVIGYVILRDHGWRCIRRLHPTTAVGLVSGCWWG
ncbi:MAG: hypothetical protein ABEI86_04800, partial [Halobacteriaceae archaeon]